MPTTDSSNPDDRDHERDNERAERSDRGGTKQKPSASASKTSKDLSHVPCKFYKVGGCTAGSSCPFSHNLAEPGGQKETCAWFVKGNCKFGHKCALAHILPGQSMAMDRKNKKAAQAAAAAAGGAERGERSERGGKDGKSGRGGNPKRETHAATGSGTTVNRANPLLAGGSTAPTRMASATPTGRPPMSLKTTLSPSAPAPPLASFGVLDDLEGDGVQLPSAPAQGKQSSLDSTTTAVPETDIEELQSKSPEPLPSSAPRSAATPTKTQDFGPIGSPPSSTHRPTANGVASTFSPGTSPHRPNGINVAPGTATDSNTGFLSGSPFSNPGAQSMFLSGSYTGGNGIAASLGSGLAMMGGKKGWGGESVGGFSGLAASSVKQIGFEYDEYDARRNIVLGRPTKQVEDTAVGDEDLEDFLPSSLNELLTPEERSRRMSRSNSGQPPVTVLPGFGAGELSPGMTGGNAGLGGHRYSRSVPAPSLLGDIKSIWSENSTAMPSSPPTHRGTPSQSFLSRSTMGHGEDMLSMSIGSTGSGMMGLSPSNASAAFLPGLHSHYLNSKAKQAQAQAQALGLGSLGKVNRATSGSMYGATSGTTGSGLASTYLLSPGSGLSSGNQVHTHTDSRTNTQHTYRTTPSPFDLTQHQHHQQPHTARPIPSNGNYTGANTNNPEDGPHLLSPSARALQSHAPGQSLPQGLAAGYSRIHAQPPPPTLHSPGNASLFGGTPPTTEAGVPSSGPYGGWRAPAQSAASPPTTGGLDSMFSRLSYSAAAAQKTNTASTAATQATAGTGSGAVTGTTQSSSASGTGAGLMPPGLSRNVSAGRYGLQGPVTPLSPLSGPVVTRDDDDDDLFSMDG